jgi:hypothetical protein
LRGDDRVFREIHVTIAAAGSIAPVAAVVSASLTSVASVTLPTLTPAKRYDERRRV